MLKKKLTYFVLFFAVSLTVVPFKALADDPDPCDPTTTGCIVTGTDPDPTHPHAVPAPVVLSLLQLLSVATGVL